MQAQNTSSAIEQDEQIDTAIMGMLFDSPRPLAVAEIEREAQPRSTWRTASLAWLASA